MLLGYTVVAWSDCLVQDQTAGACNSAVEKLADYLKVLSVREYCSSGLLIV